MLAVSLTVSQSFSPVRYRHLSSTTDCIPLYQLPRLYERISHQSHSYLIFCLGKLIFRHRRADGSRSYNTSIAGSIFLNGGGEVASFEEPSIDW